MAPPSEIVALIRRQITERLQVEEEEQGRIAVYTPFMYQDGDHCSFVAVRDAARSCWYLTDEGEVLAHAGYSGVNLLANDRVRRFRETTKFYGVTERRGELSLPVDNEMFGNAVFSFTQACLDIVELTKLPAERRNRATADFKSALRRLITTTIPRGEVEEKWYDEKTDPERVYPVDLRIRGKSRPLYLYEATTDRHCLTSAVSCLHHKLAQSNFIGVAIFDDEEAIPRIARIPLVQAVTKHFSSRSQSDAIRDFLLTEAA